MPEHGATNDPIFMASLLRLDPNFENLPSDISSKVVQNATSFSLSPDESKQVRECLEQRGLKVSPRVNALLTPKDRVLHALDSAYLDSLYNFDAEKAKEIAGLKSAVGRVDAPDLRGILDRAESVASHKEGPYLSARDRNGRKFAKIAIGAASIALGIGLISVPWDPGLGAIARPIATIGLHTAAAMGGFKTLRLVSEEIPDAAKEVRDCAQRVRSAEPYLVGLCETLPKPGESVGFTVSRAEIIDAAVKKLSQSETSLELNSYQMVVNTLNTLGGNNASELFKNAFEEADQNPNDPVVRMVGQLGREILDQQKA